jgi:hypothetical protein
MPVHEGQTATALIKGGESESIPVKVNFENLWPNHLQEEVIKNWRLYGFEELPEVKRQKESFQFL